jgi:O-antigen/teichoic acid export membrane protein
MLTKLFKRTGAVAVGTGVGQGLIVLTTPFLARRYSPAEFGTLALLMSVSNISLAVACARYDIALPSAADKDVRGLLVTSIVVAAALGGATTIVALLLHGSRLTEHTGGLLDRPFLIGACVLLVGLYQAMSAWLLRRSRYRGVAAMRLAQGGGFSALAVLPGIGLLWAHVMSFAGGLLAILGVRCRSEQDARWTEAARRYGKFPIYGLPGSALDVTGYSICIWVVTSAYGRAWAGEYSQIQRLIGAPLMLMSISLGQILLKHTADLAHDIPQMRILLTRLLRMMAGGAIVALACLAVVGKPLIARFLGPSWHVEREMVVLLGAAVFMRACVSPLSAALLSLRRFGLILSWQAAYFCSASLLMPLVASHVPFQQYVRFYAAHELVFYGAYLYLIYFAMRSERCVESLAS